MYQVRAQGEEAADPLRDRLAPGLPALPAAAGEAQPRAALPAAAAAAAAATTTTTTIIITIIILIIIMIMTIIIMMLITIHIIITNSNHCDHRAFRARRSPSRSRPSTTKPIILSYY